MCEFGPQLRPNYGSPVRCCILEEVLKEHLSSKASEHRSHRGFGGSSDSGPGAAPPTRLPQALLSPSYETIMVHDGLLPPLIFFFLLSDRGKMMCNLIQNALVCFHLLF